MFPREKAIDLSEFASPGKYQPYTWEGCVVKLADKIAYLGRDIEDAVRMDFITVDDLRELKHIAKKYGEKAVNTTVIMHNFIISICENSSPETGIRLSEQYSNMLNEVKSFNIRAIYKNEKFDVYRNYAALVIRSIFDTLIKAYKGSDTPIELRRLRRYYPTLIKDFLNHIYHYSELKPIYKQKEILLNKYQNKKIYGYLENKTTYAEAIIDYISGMTDRYAITCFNELLKY